MKLKDVINEFEYTGLKDKTMLKYNDPKTGEIKGSKRETKPIPKTKGVETELTKRREKAAEAGYELPEGSKYKGKDATIES